MDGWDTKCVVVVVIVVVAVNVAAFGSEFAGQK